MKKVRYYFPYKIPFEAVDWDAYLSVRRSVRLLKQVQQLDDAYYMVFDYVSQQLIHSSSPTYVYSEQSDVALRHLNTHYVIDTDYYERFLNFRASALDRYAGLAEPERREWEVIYSISTGKDDMKTPPAVMIKMVSLLFSRSGQVAMALLKMVDSHDTNAETRLFYHRQRREMVRYDPLSGQWGTPFILRELTQDERHILVLSSQGVPVEKMADRIFLSPHTIRARIRDLQEYYRVSNIRSLIGILRILTLI